MPWYVIRTKPQHEIKSAQRLEKLGLEIFCPTIEEVRQWSDRKKKITVPLFKSYLFVKLQPNARNLVFDVPGVLNFVYWLKKPAIARDEEIEIIKAWLNNDQLNDFELNFLQVGDELEIKIGKLKNKKAIIKEIGKNKLKLILPEIGWTLTTKLNDVL